MKKLLFICIVWVLFPLFALASDVTVPPLMVYPFQSSLIIQEDFLGGNQASGTLGNYGLTFTGGTAAQIPSEANRPGILRRDTTTTISTLTSTRTCIATGACIDPSLPTRLAWVARLNTNDANTQVRLGSSTALVNPPTHGIYFEKLDADTNWFCVTRAAGVQTRVDSTIAVNTSFTTFHFSRNSSGVLFYINNVNVCGLMTTNIPTVFVTAEVTIINSAAAAKTIDLDYFSLILTGLVR